MKAHLGAIGGLATMLLASILHGAAPHHAATSLLPRAKPIKIMPTYPVTSPIEFKGARLGMTFDEWKALPFPAAPQETLFADLPWQAGPVSVMCSNEPHDGPFGSDIFVADYEAKLGVKECRYRVRTRTGIRPAWVAVAEGGANNVFYRFLDGKLFEISITASSNFKAKVFAGLMAKFGPPTQSITDLVQNGIGLPFSHEKSVWLSGPRAISYEAPFGSLTYLNVLYVDTEILEKVSNAREAAHPAATAM